MAVSPFPVGHLARTKSAASMQVLLAASAFIACLAIGLSHAQNHPPTLILSVGLMGKDEVLAASEGTPVNSLLGVLQVKDVDSGPEGEVDCVIASRFVGLEEMARNFYKVELTTHLDRELADHEEVVISCSDRGSPPLVRHASLNIVITDVNDNVPAFQQPRYTFSVLENAEPDKPIGRVVATDMDEGENGDLEYSLDDENGELSSQFAIDSSTGEISCTQRIDREVQDRIVLYAYASDRGSTPLVGEAEVVIEIEDKNDNYPSFVTRSMSIKEELPPLSLVGTIIGHDADIGKNAEIEYSLVMDDDGASIPPFIVEANGSVYAFVPLDREQRDEYTIQVSASDSGEPVRTNTTYITITVLDVNDHAPAIISPSNEEGSESADVVSVDWSSPEVDRAVFGVLATDPDIQENGRLSYAIDSINAKPADDDSLFAIDRHTGRVSLRRFVRPDDEPVQILNLVVSDAGTPSHSSLAWLNVSLDVDFSALATPPPPDSSKSPAGNSGSPGAEAVAHLLCWCLSFCLLTILHQPRYSW